jgi:acyl-CoA synthetase (AMP-forming)/AMP-acid ligase II
MTVAPITLRWDPSVLPEPARAALVGLGAPFELVDEPVLGVPVPSFARRARNLRQLFEAGTRDKANLDYLVFPHRTLTFGQAARLANRMAEVLRRDYGLGKGDRVGIASANSLAYAVAWWASVNSGAVVAGLNGWWTPSELAYGVSLTSPKVILVDERRAERFSHTDVTTPIVLLDDLLAAAEALPDDPPAPDVPIDEDDPWIILFTSGTTGRPKGALLSHRNIVHVSMSTALNGAVVAMQTGQAPSADQPASICASPFFHVSGTLPLAYGPIFGGKLVFAPPGAWDETTHLRLTQEHRVSAWSGVPTQFWRLLQHPDLASYDLSSVKSMGGGGAVFSPELQRLFAEKMPNARVGTGYGMSETVGSGTRLGGSMVFEQPSSIGTVEPTCELQIRSEDGEVLGENEIGEIYLRGGCVFLGYWDNPEATAKALDAERWYATGDFGRIADGIVYLEARLRDLIIRGGENIYPIEIENRLVEHPDVYEACVVGIDHQVLGQEVAAVVVPERGTTIDATALRKWVAEALAAYKVPTIIEFRDALPYTASGKVLKHELEAELNALAASARASSKGAN